MWTLCFALLVSTLALEDKGKPSTLMEEEGQEALTNGREGIMGFFTEMEGEEADGQSE